MQNWRIKFDNNTEGTFFTGETIAGKVIFENKKSKQIFYISIIFEGCEWFYHGYTSSYCGDYLIKKEIKYSPNQNKFVLEKGIHEFSFSFTIPKVFPSSLESVNGLENGRSIDYYLDIHLKRPWWKFDYRHRFPLTIIKNYDLSLVNPRHL